MTHADPATPSRRSRTTARPLRAAYIALWFPKASETFVFYEIKRLIDLGATVQAYALYGPLTEGLSSAMTSPDFPVENLGLRRLFSGFAGDLFHWLARKPKVVGRFFRKLIFRWGWRDWEMFGENFWAAFSGLTLARRFEEAEIDHIHAAWAGGPATAAWIASELTGIPFSFAARAGDIYPEDGTLADKLKAAAVVRLDAAFNRSYLAGFAPSQAYKIHVVRNVLSWAPESEAEVSMTSPVRLVAVGRFVETKGFDVLIRAMALLRDQGVETRLNLVGSGSLEAEYRSLAQELGVADRIDWPGFVSHDNLRRCFLEADLFVMPSKIRENGDRDGLPTVIMEALMHRVPTIATDVGGIREVVENEVTGLLVPQNAVEPLAQAIKRFAKDREFALKTAQAGKVRVLDFYDPPKNTQALYDLFAAHSVKA